MYIPTMLMAAPPQGGTAAGTTAGGGWMGLMPFVLMILIFWLLVLRPQAKKQKEIATMLQDLKEDDKVITSSGIIGKIVSFRPDKDIVILEVDETNHVRIQFQRSAIAGVMAKSGNE